jgi:hypothetical protein
MITLIVKFCQNVSTIATLEILILRIRFIRLSLGSDFLKTKLQFVLRLYFMNYAFLAS